MQRSTTGGLGSAAMVGIFVAAMAMASAGNVGAQDAESAPAAGVVIPTDGQWKAMSRPLEGWMNPEFDDRQWAAASTGYAQNTGRNRQLAPAVFFGQATDAQWIWANGSADCGLRRSFELEKIPARAEIWIACDDDATIYCNGHRIGFWSTTFSWGVLAGGVSRFDLRPYLVTGKNVVAIFAHDQGISYGLMAEIRLDAPRLAPLAMPDAPADTDPAFHEILAAVQAIAEAAESDLPAATARVTAMGAAALWALNLMVDEFASAQSDEAKQAHARLAAVRGDILDTLGLPANPMALGTLKQAFAGYTERRWRRHWLHTLRHFAAQTRSESVAFLKSILEGPDAAARADAAQIAGVLGLRELAEDVAKLAQTTETPDEALAVLSALAEIGGRTQVPAVKGMTERFDHPVITPYAATLAEELAARD